MIVSNSGHLVSRLGWTQIRFPQEHPGFEARHDRVLTKPLYRPAGIWWWYRIRDIDPYKKGFPLLFYFPPPYHPVEIAALMVRGFGGYKEQDGPLTDSEWETVRKMQALRFAQWATYTEALAKDLSLTVSECRLLYHLFTPLATNGVEPENDAAIRAARREWWALMGFECAHWDHKCRADYHSVPHRNNFFGGEVKGTVDI